MNSDSPCVRLGEFSTLVVRATTSIFVAASTPVIQILRPLRRQPFPVLVAKVLISRLLEPASGSVSAMQQLISPETIFGRSSAFIAGVPNFESATPPKMGLIMNS